MEKVINISLKKQPNLRKLKIKIFSKTLNSQYNLNLKELFIFYVQPFISNSFTRERLALKEDCFSNKLFENIDSYYPIDQSKEKLISIIKTKTRTNKYTHLYPNYITLEKFFFEKMSKYRTQKTKAEYDLYMLNKTREKSKQKNNKSKRLSYFIKPDYEFIDTIKVEGIKTFNRRTSKKISIIRRKREKKVAKNVVLLKQDMFKANDKFKEFIEKRENIFLINNLENSLNKIKIYHFQLKKKSTNLFFNIFNKILERKKNIFQRQFFYKLNAINNLYKRQKNILLKTVIISSRPKYKKILNRYSLMQRNSLIPKLFDELNKNENLIEKNKIKFRPNYLFDKRNNKVDNDFDIFFKDWNKNRTKQMIDNIYKYTSENFNANHNLLFSQINKLIKNNKIENLEKEVHKSKSKHDTKRINTISNSIKTKNKNIKLKKYSYENTETNNEKKKKLLLNLKYQL